MSQNIYSPFGKRINLGTHELHINVTGKGSPTVVLVSGGSSWSMDWYPVQKELSKFTTVCSYDRAGYGWSDLGPKPRSTENIVNELHLLLKKANVPKPYIFVGASFGGHTVRHYFHKFPEEVIGIILLDARHEEFNKIMPQAWHEYGKKWEKLIKLLYFIFRVDIFGLLNSLFGKKFIPPFVRLYPGEYQKTYQKVGINWKFFKVGLDELEAVDESDLIVSESGLLGDMPLTVIRHGIPDLFSFLPEEQARESEQIWQELQNQLTGLSKNVRSVVAEKSGHNIACDQPELVIEEIRKMIEIVH